VRTRAAMTQSVNTAPTMKTRSGSGDANALMCSAMYGQWLAPQTLISADVTLSAVMFVGLLSSDTAAEKPGSWPDPMISDPTRLPTTDPVWMNASRKPLTRTTAFCWRRFTLTLLVVVVDSSVRRSHKSAATRLYANSPLKHYDSETLA